MASKRAKVTHYVSGRNQPVVQFVLHHSSRQSAKTSSRTHQKRPPAPRIITFSAKGSLQPKIPTMSQFSSDESHPSIDDLPLLDPPLDELGSEPDDSSPSEESRESKETDSTRKTANLLLASWLSESSDDYLHIRYESEAPPGSSVCDHCQLNAEAIFRCVSCMGSPTYSCAACLASAHCRTPTHRIERFDFDEMLWTSASLADIGCVLHLGHRGAACTSNNLLSRILVGHKNGFTTIQVHYCTCLHAPSKGLQLLLAGLFPCTDQHPRSAFSIPLLEMYNIFLTLGRTSAHKFYSVLERLSKPGFPVDLKDRYRELMMTHRKYLFLLNLQRSARHFAHHETDVNPGDQALDCVACPRPGVNFNWAEVPEDEYEWFRVFFSYDGNFRSVRKSKKVEHGDLCLSDGLAYFSRKEPYKEWTIGVAQLQPQRTEKPTCDHHKAGNDNAVKSAGRDVTGVGALTCTSHSCFVPRGMVDFFKGERFIYADYAFASTVAHLSRRGTVSYGLTYDVWCHWIVNLTKRAENLPSSIALPQDLNLVGGIPKFHLPGHDLSCYVRYSLDNMQHVGRMEGEGPERVWSHLNQHSGSTSEQGPGVRTDTINNLAYEWNYEKMIRMDRHLIGKFKEAKKMYRQQKTVHEDLAACLPDDEIAEWETESLEPTQDARGKWSSPLMDPVWTDGSFQSVVREETKLESSTSRVLRRRPGVTRWLADGIELEHNMRRIEEEAKEHTDPTPRQADSLNKQRINLRDRIVKHQKQRAGLTGALAGQEPDHPDVPPSVDDEPEHSQLGLPSSFLPSSLTTSRASSLADLEFELRRGTCEDALDSLRRLLGARALTYRYKDQHIRGQVPTTRAQDSIRAYTAKITKAKWRYDNSRSAMIRLDVDASILERYQEIASEDLKSLKSYLEDESRGTGQGYASIPWIWRNYNGRDAENWQVTALKTEWFRSRERYKRWEEQLVLLKREMVMTIRTFRAQEESWSWKARVRCPTTGMRGYALKQSRFYGELARRALRAFRSDIQDDIVTLKWAEIWLRNNANDQGFLSDALGATS